MGREVAKYCMDGSGKFVIINKNSGLDHGQVSLLLEDEPVSAGFVVEMGNELIAYGQSITLNLDSRDSDTQTMLDALAEGRMRSMWDEVTDSWVAGTIDHIPMGDVISDLAGLQEKRII